MTDAAEAKALFLQAIELPAEERAAFLARSCGDDAELRARVESLLAAHARGEADLPTAGGLAGVAASALVELDVGPGDTVGNYRLEKELGEGGFGRVFRAEQLRPVQRKVALKVIKLGMDTRQVIARFEAERQVLALMDHPHIARVFDAGATRSGRPYFVMELVEGRPITAYCDSLGLDRRTRLQLFRDVCMAIHHAHAKGVVHRDIKPTNVLVTEIDGTPQPRVIDFGVAKAMRGVGADASFVSKEGHVVGTPAYMSPEQASGQADIDTRSDVYALGVLLFELLTGRPPFELWGDGIESFGELQRRIVEVEPRTPSAVVAGSATGRGREGALPQELDWIALRCLEKSRDRRYPTANALALDVERFLDGRPIEAAPPSRTYRIRKWVRRHRAAAIGILAVTSSLLVGIVGTSIGLVRAARANEELGAALRDVRVARDSSERVTDFLVEQFRALEPELKRGRPLQVSELLDRAAQALEGEIGRSPREAARLRDAVGGGYFALGLYAQAEPLLEQALRDREKLLGEDDPATLASMNSLGLLYADMGRREEAEPLYLRALDKRRKVLGENHPDTLKSLNNLASLYAGLGRNEKAEPLYVEAVERTRAALGEEDPVTLIALHNLAHFYATLGRYEEVEPLYLEVLEKRRKVLGDDHPHTLAALHNLASLYQDQGRTEEALALYLEMVKTSRKVLGEDHPQTLASLNSLAFLYRGAGRLSEAEPIYASVLERRRAVLGEDHPDTLTSLNNLGVLYQSQGRLAEAEALHREELAKARAVLGENHPDTLVTLNNLAALCQAQKRYEEAEALYAEALDRSRAVLGEDHPHTLTAMSNLAGLFAILDRNAEAEPLYVEALAKRRALLGEDHPDAISSTVKLAALYRDQGRYEEAEPLYVEALARYRSAFGPDDPRTLACLDGLARLYEQWVQGLRRTMGPEHPATLGAMRKGGVLAARWGHDERAEVALRACLEGRLAALGPEDPDTLESFQDLAELYAAAGRWDEAEPLARELLDLTHVEAEERSAREELLERISRELR